MSISILLADDHNIFREGLKVILEQESDFNIVADTNDGSKAWELSLSLVPDVAILDISMPQLTGIETARRILARGLKTRVIILSMHMDKEYVAEALRIGAHGVLAKTCAAGELINAIRQVAAGQSYLSPTVSDALIGIISSPKPLGVASLPPGKSNKLTQRENEVLRLLAEGHCAKEVASLLTISIKTVETYRLNLMRKLQITSMVALVKHAIREGIINLN